MYCVCNDYTRDEQDPGRNPSSTSGCHDDALELLLIWSDRCSEGRRSGRRTTKPSHAYREEAMGTKGPLLEVPLEDCARVSPFKRLTTAVSIESPDLFRISGVPCIDRGPDRSRPPLPFEHWAGGSGCYSSSANDAVAERLKRSANFARPSSVSADAPNTFKVRKRRSL